MVCRYLLMWVCLTKNSAPLKLKYEYQQQKILDFVIDNQKLPQQKCMAVMNHTKPPTYIWNKTNTKLLPETRKKETLNSEKNKRLIKTPNISINIYRLLPGKFELKGIIVIRFDMEKSSSLEDVGEIKYTSCEYCSVVKLTLYSWTSPGPWLGVPGGCSWEGKRRNKNVYWDRYTPTHMRWWKNRNKYMQNKRRKREREE